MSKAGLIKVKIFFMKAGLTLAYQLLLTVTCFFIAVYAVSPVCMILVCVGLRLNRLPDTGILTAWLTGSAFVAVPIYIVETIKFVKRRKEETLQNMKKKSEEIKK